MPEPRSFGLSLTDRPAVGLRHDAERRSHERRSRGRSRSERRHAERRKARVRGFLFSALAVAFPSQMKPGLLLNIAPTASVSVAVERYEAVPARQAYEGMIREAAAAYDLDPALIRSVIETESAFDATAVSRAGAVGLMQLMPEVAASLGVENLTDPRESIMGGAQLLRELIDRYDGNLSLVLASYNAGATAVARFGGIPPFPETQAYVKKVTRLIKKSRELNGD